MKAIASISIAVFSLVPLLPARADFPHAIFNTSVVASVVVCNPGFEGTPVGERAVPTDVTLVHSNVVSLLHSLAQTEHCALPHVTGTSEKLAILAYQDAAGKPLALVQLWPTGIYYIYEGFRDDQGNVYKGHAQGDHGGCSCGLNLELARAVSAVLGKDSKRPAEADTPPAVN